MYLPERMTWTAGGQLSRLLRLPLSLTFRLTLHAALSLISGLVLSLLSSAIDATERVVAINHPNAQDQGAGTEAAPYKTLSYAMSQLQPGDHLIIEAGTYRDALVFPDNRWKRIDPATITSGKLQDNTGRQQEPTRIEGRGKVLIKGSDLVSDWRSLGNGRFVKVWPDETQQVYIDGMPLVQIGGTIFSGFPSKSNHPLAALHQSQKGIWPGRIEGNQHTMPNNSFYYDAPAKALYLQTTLASLQGHQVEVSVRPALLRAYGATDITVRNLDFAHGNTSTRLRDGLVSMSGARHTIDDIHVRQGDSIGIALIGNDITLRNSSANHCGQLGIMARGERIQLINNETSDNNTRGFNKWWEAGGAKFVGNGGLQDSLVSQHKSLRNMGDGIWFDWKNRNNTLQYSMAAYNSGFGIHYEASDQGRILHNVSVANRQRGIYLSHSSQTLVAFNLVAANQLQGIAVIDENRRDPKAEFDFSAKGNKLLANVVAWNAGAIVLPTQQADNISDYNVLIGDDAQTRTGAGWMNMFMVTLEEWTKRTRQDQHSSRMSMPMDPAFQLSVNERILPDLAFYHALRRNFKPAPLSDALKKSLPEVTDYRPGPSLSTPADNKISDRDKQ